MMGDETSNGSEVVQEILKKSVSCNNIPEAFLDKTVAKKHFAQFGRIHSFTLSPKRRTCTVEYDTEDAAEIALIDGGFFNGEVFEIFFTPKATATPRPMIDYIDPDVQDELNAMAPRKHPYFRAADVMETQTVKPNMTTKMEAKRVPRVKSANEPIGIRPTTKISVPVKPVDQIARNELETIMRKPAFTSEEKYRVLDARDKLVRLTTLRSTDIKTAVTIKGVCPDMCPEKERLMREATHRVSSYELEDNSKNVMKHSLALKQYARSSADQETALPHELRPEPILKMTMNYLLHNIVDLCDSTDGNIGDWFHFVWDRTRSIRKDISQQELCSQTAVTLVEQCARFHIHCAARLVAEEAQVFDQKINSENLTKCLQSLKYLYHDLHLHREQCPNEAEFRAYVVLLNLNDCQFFWEVKQFPHHILHSKEIRFAIEVYLAMANNNYVKFFKLVRQTTYMNACILLRYFNQVRVSALSTMVKAYVARAPVAMNISYWNYVLAFEDYEQTAQFFEYYGMQCDRNDDRVLLDRNAFYYPDLPFILDRAINVVEHKRVCSVGEVIHGGVLGKFDEFLKYAPHDSFDENGLLSPDAWTAEDQNYLNPPTPKRKSQHTPFRDEDSVFKIPQAPLRTSPNPRPSIFTKLSPRTPSADTTSIFSNFGNTTSSSSSSNYTNVFGGKSSFSDSLSSKNIFQLPTMNDSPEAKIFGNRTATIEPKIESKSLPITTPNSTNNLFSITNNKPNSIFGGSSALPGIFANFPQNSSTKSTLVSKASNAFLKDPRLEPKKDIDLKQMEAEKRKIEMEIRKAKEASEQLKKQEEEKLLKEMQKKNEEKEKMEKEKLAKEKMEKEKSEKEIIERQKADALKTLKQNEISEKTLLDLVNEFVNQSLEEFAKASLEYHHQIENVALEVYYELLAEIMFEESADWERRRQEKIEKIQNTPIWMPDTPMLQLVPNLMHPLQGLTLNMKKRYRDGVPCNLKLPVIQEDLLDIFDIVPLQLQRNRSQMERIIKKPMFWKCGISIPDSTEDKSSRIENKLNKMFRKRQSLSKWFFCEQKFVQSVQQDVAICLRKLTGSEMRNEEGLIDFNDTNGLNAIVFLMAVENPKETKKRLLKVLEHQKEDCPIAVVLFIGDDVHEKHLRSELELDELINTSDSPMKYFHLRVPDNATRFPSIQTKLIRKCFQFVAFHYNFKSLLEMQSTVKFLDQCLCDQFWKRILTSSTLNPGLFKAATKINFIIDIYNAALSQLENITNIDISSHPLFPQEFKDFVKPISDEIPQEYQHFPNDWKNPNRSKRLQEFLSSLKLPPVTLKMTTIDDIKQQLKDYAYCLITERQISDRVAYRMIQCLTEHVEAHSEEAFEYQMNTFNWIESIRLLSLEILNFNYRISEPAIPAEVIYNRDELKRYLHDPWWLMENGPLSNLRLSLSQSDDGISNAKKPRLVSIDKDEIEELLVKSANCLIEADKKINKFKETVNASRELTKELDAMLYEHEKMLRVQKRWYTCKKD